MPDPAPGTRHNAAASESHYAADHDAAHHETAHHKDGPVPKFLYLVYAGIATFFVYYLIVHWRG